MKNLVLKTTLFTLLGVLTTLGILFGVFALFFPKNLASVADQMGNYGVSVFYYEKAYEKSGSTFDLYDLVVNLDEKIDCQKSFKYSGELLKKEDFSVLEKGENPTTREFISAKYATSAFLSNESYTAIAFSENFVLSNGYKEFNPFTVSINQALTKLDKETANLVMQKLESLKSQVNSSEELALINSDISLINAYINK